MTLRFIHPPLEGPVTGGTRYNQALIRTAERLGIRLDSIAWQGQSDWPGLLAQFDSRNDLLLWDSLFLRDLAGWPGLRDWPRQGLLVHYLPFANPLLDAAERVQWQDRFLRVAQGMRFLLATGARVADEMRQNQPHCAVFLREPQVDPIFHQWRSHRRTHAEPGPLRLITVANLLPGKRQRELLELLASIDANWEWHLAGETDIDPDYAEALRQRISQWGLTHRVVWHSPLPPESLARLMASMDLFVSYSAFESYGMALAEAAAMGLPILTTGVGEAERLVRTGSIGLVIPLERPDVFAQAITQLLTDEPYRLGLGVGQK
jgi:glycosyltransferase involved in cell wall biosynthesis